MSWHQLTKEESEPAEHARRDVMLRAWLKPRIKRQAGTWVCCGRGVTETGYSPQSAHNAWLMAQQIQEIYAQAGRVFSRCLTA